MIKYLLLSFFIIAVSCNQSPSSNNQKISIALKDKPVIIILQPIGNFSKTTLKFLEDSIPKFYTVKIVIASPEAFPSNAYYASRKRYRADTIINWLKQIKPDSARLIVALTNSDISTTKGSIKDYGVMGLGFQPGVACVVSSFRLQNDHPSQQLLQQRIFKTVVHEIGHNFGLPHCSNKNCIMADAEGKLNQDNEKDLGEECKKKLKIE